MHSFINNSTAFNQSLLFQIENNLFMFGIPEGIQKLFNEKKKSLKTVSCFIITERTELISLIGICHTLSEINSEINILLNFLSETEMEELNSSILPGRINLLNKIENEVCKISIEKNGFLIEFKRIRDGFQIKKLLKKAPDFPKQRISELINGINVFHNNISYTSEEFLTYKIIKPIYIFTKEVIDESVESLTILNNCELVFCFKNYTFDKFIKKNIKTKFISIPLENYISPSVLKFKDVMNKFDSRILKPVMHPLNQKVVDSGTLTNTIEFDKTTCRYVSNTNNLIINDYILFLGTGSAIPTKYRNVSSCLLNIKKRVFLLDCGEGTINQIYTALGNISVLDDLTAILISHAHADHFLGMFSIIDYVFSTTNKKINVFAPSNLIKYIKFFKYEEKINLFESTGSLNELICGVNIKSCEVEHRIYSNAYVLNILGFVVSYSGDCRPSQIFGKLAEKSDVMIHESTFNDDMVDDAIRTGHSTYSEAVDVFKQSNSKKLFLTHFSQRYNNKVDFELFDPEIMIAYDLLLYNLKPLDSKRIQKHILKNFPE